MTGAASLAAVALSLGPATPAPADEGDPPERIAYVDLLEGSGAVQPAGISEWTADIVNRPLTSGDRVWVDDASRAELHLGSTALRLGQDTGLQFLNLGDRITQLRLTAGSLNLRVRYLSPDETVEVDTPNAAVSLLQAGEYRIDVNDSGDAVAVAVRRGRAEVSGQTQSFSIDQRQQGEFIGAGTLAVNFADLAPADGFDQWAENRDAREDAALSANYVSRDVTGYENLDDYGAWQNEPDYGQVWVPRVAAGWIPYSTGHWVWVSPWGWTWVDEAPWGFAPFHYGRWVHARFGWCWSPGRIAVRPVYAPALVAWVAAGGAVAWVPLGYNEVYRPVYRAGDAYVRRINVTNTYIDGTSILEKETPDNRHFANQAIPGAVTAVARAVFVAAQPVGRGAIKIDPQAAAAAPAATTQNAIAPSPHSYAATPANGPGVAVVPRQDVFRRPVVTRTAPPRVRGAPLDEHRDILTTVPRAEPAPRPYVPPQMAPARAAPPAGESPAARQAPAARPSIPGRDAHTPSPDRPAVMPPPHPQVESRGIERGVAPPRKEPAPNEAPPQKSRDNRTAKPER